MKYLNLGCGARYIPSSSWSNVDFVSKGKSVLTYDLNRGIPYSDNTFDLVYHSHVLEHFPREDASKFLAECFRVLKPGGFIRVVVPDLQLLAARYLDAYEKAKNAEVGWEANYNWAVIHLLDQGVRDISGGQMMKYISQKNIPNKQFVISAWGVEAEGVIEKIKQKQQCAEVTRGKRISPLFLMNKIKKIREPLLRVLLGAEDYDSLRAGRFRKGGEVHKWMYENYSLSKILVNCNFDGVVERTAKDSYFQGWSEFCLDTESDGTIYRPDSLYMEAKKKS